ncbi:MAG: hypothetical protein MI725_10730 [Pirellulales bacterium]|nr:hypothetical protein [Pirellulales bacterium]
MTEVWLRSNRRVLLVAMAPVVVLGFFGLVMWQTDLLPLPGQLGALCIVAAALLLAGLIHQLRQPRVAYRNGSVLFYLKAGAPIRVPVGVVEGFFLGQGPAHLPGNSRNETKMVNLIARLSQREPQWQQRNVKAALGTWSEGYVTIHGTWCEPLTTDVIRRLNQRLREVTQEQSASTE